MVQTESNQAFLRCITGDYSDDLWSDVVIEDAIQLANAMSIEDWKSIYTEFSEYDDLTRFRIAQIVTDVSGRNEYLGYMLYDMLSSSNCEVVEASVDSLNSLSQSQPQNLNLEKLQLLLKEEFSGGDLFNRVLESLRQRVEELLK